MLVCEGRVMAMSVVSAYMVKAPVAMRWRTLGASARRRTSGRQPSMEKMTAWWTRATGKGGIGAGGVRQRMMPLHARRPPSRRRMRGVVQRWGITGLRARTGWGDHRQRLVLRGE
jgi:hypothetical protein